MAKKRVFQKWCVCIELVQEKLEKEHGARLIRLPRLNFKTQTLGFTPPVLAIERAGSSKRRKLPTVVCSHCPFCGTKYPE